MAEDLLEDMDQDQIDEKNREVESPKGKFAFLKRLLGNKKKLIIIILAAVLVVAAAAGAWFLFFSGSGEEETVPEATATQETAEGPKEEIIFEDIVVLEPFERIPLKGGSAMGMISLTVALELTDHRFRKQVYTVQDRLGRMVTAKVREMDWLELRNPEGKIKLKYELLKQMNGIFPKVTIRNIYFTNFLMQ